jgi:hypothetical protein
MVQHRKSEQMTTGETVAAKVAVYKWIRELVTWLEKETKAELADEMKPGDHQQALLAGQNVGTIGMVNARRTFYSTDDDRLAEWVTERWPDEVVVRVRPEFLDQLKKRAREYGALIDDDGEVCPWAEVRLGEPQLNTNINAELITEIIQERLGKGHTIEGIIRELSEGTTR